MSVMPFGPALALLLLLLPTAPPRAARPNPTLTPGVSRSLTRDVVCTTRWGRDRRGVTLAMKRQVFRAYGLPWSQHARYEVDHLIPRELAGADDVKNLWPQPWRGPYNAHDKDRLENRLHVLVCAQTLSLTDAQQMIAADWIAAYARYLP